MSHLKSHRYLIGWLSLCCWIVSMCTNIVNAANILLISGRSYSHCRLLASIGEELLERNHSVSIFLDERLDINKCTDANEMHRISLATRPDVDGVEQIQKQVLSEIKSASNSSFSFAGLLPGISHASCRALFRNNTIIDKLKNENFDIVLVDGMFFFYCYYIVPYKLNIPYISVSTFYSEFVTGQPFIPSIFPARILGYSDRMTFTQRLVNTICSIVFYLVQPLFIPTDIISEIAPNLSAWDVFNLASKSELFLENRDHLLDYNKPLPDGHILVGGVTAKTSKPLPRDLNIFVNNAKDDVIIVSFGSILESIPHEITEKLSLSLQKLQAAILWKQNKETEFANIKTVKWLPQNDLLGHQKVKLFISHCGNIGVYEALYHGVPLLCMPLYGDQIVFAASVKERRYGLIVNLLTDSQEEIDKTLNEMITNRIYEKSIKLASKIFHDRENGPRQRAAFWIEHVIKYGGKHLRSRALDIPVYQYMNLDTYVAIASVGVIVAYIWYRVIYLVIKWCYVKVRKRKHKSD